MFLLPSLIGSRFLLPIYFRPPVLFLHSSFDFYRLFFIGSHIKNWLMLPEWRFISVTLIHLGSGARTKTLMVCFVNSFPKELSFPTFPMMIYSILLISSIIVPVNALVFVLPSKCFINFFVDFVALDLTIYQEENEKLKKKQSYLLLSETLSLYSVGVIFIRVLNWRIKCSSHLYPHISAIWAIGISVVESRYFEYSMRLWITSFITLMPKTSLYKCWKYDLLKVSWWARPSTFQSWYGLLYILSGE